MTLKPREIWDLATPLNDAWLRFSDSKLRGQYEEPFGTDGVGPIDFEKGFWDTAQAVIGHLSKAVTAPQVRENIIQEMRKSLLEKLSKDSLIGMAFPIWPSEARIPRPIHAPFWINSDIDWEAGMASDASSKFHKIRIINPADFPAINFKPAIGRTTHRDLIYAATAECVARDPDFPEKTNQRKVDIVRLQIRTIQPGLDPSGKGLGEAAVRKHITKYLKDRGLSN
jgi:hypothetical protein